MTSPFYDVAIIGGGIAGTCAALALAQRGAHVVLLEAGTFPRHKVCGEFFSGESRPVFARLGLDESLAQSPLHPIRESHLIAPSGRRVRLRVPEGAFALSRYAFDTLLWEAAQRAGVVCHARTRVKGLRREGRDSLIATGRGTAADTLLRARVVIIAVGRNPADALLGIAPREEAAASPTPSQATQFVGLKAHFQGAHLPTGRVEMHGFAGQTINHEAHASEGGYCGLARVENGLTNVCLLVRATTLQKRAPEAFFGALLAHYPLLRARMGKAERVTPWLATANVRFGLRHPTAATGLVCGDAAGYIPPLAGDGMSMAARSGELAGEVVAKQLNGTLDADQTGSTYQGAWDVEFGARLRWAEALQAIGLHRHGAEAAVGVLRLLPPLRSWAVRLTRG